MLEVCKFAKFESGTDWSRGRSRVARQVIRATDRRRHVRTSYARTIRAHSRFLLQIFLPKRTSCCTDIAVPTRFLLHSVTPGSTCMQCHCRVYVVRLPYMYRIHVPYLPILLQLHVRVHMYFFLDRTTTKAQKHSSLSDASTHAFIRSGISFSSL